MAIGLFCSRHVAGFGHLTRLRVSSQSGRAEQKLFLGARDTGNEYFDGTCNDDCLRHECGYGGHAGVAGDGNGSEPVRVEGGGRADGDGESAVADQRGGCCDGRVGGRFDVAKKALSAE